MARLGGVTLAGSALGIPHPLAAALLVVPALELAGVVPLTPANVGIAGGAAAVAFHALRRAHPPTTLVTVPSPLVP